MTSLQDMDAKANGLKMIVACEYSGTVRDAFSSLGWDAWSCDLLPTESELTKAEGKHYQGDIFDFIGSRDWDLMIGHPPCDYISYAGTAWWNEPGRVFKRLEGLNFFARLYEAYPHIPHICLENPKSCASPTIAKYTQEIQPYYFGDPQLKTTWLWLRDLPPLQYNLKRDCEILFGDITGTDRPEPISVDNTARKKKRYFTDGSSCSPKERARFWPGIANAMAVQWTEYILADGINQKRRTAGLSR